MNNSKIFTLPQLCEAVNRENFARCELLDQSGARATKGHPANEKPIKWIKGHVSDWAKRPSTEAGYYFLYCYDSPSKKTKPVIYTVKIGNPPALSEPSAPSPIIIQQPAAPIENPLSWDSALKYQSEIGALKSDITRLQIENDNLRAQLNDFESLEEPAEEPLGLLNENFLSGTIMPALNAFFDNQKQNRHIQFYQMAAKNPALWHTPMGMQILHEQGATAQPIAAPSPAPKSPKSDAALINLCNDFFDLCEEDQFNTIEQIKNSCSNLPDFFKTLKDQAPEIYENLVSYVKDRGGKL